MSNLSESIQLLGLAITTLPFEYDGEIATATLNTNVNIEDLQAIRDSLQVERDEMDEEKTEDHIKRQKSDDIYFVSKIIDALNNKLDGNNLQ